MDRTHGVIMAGGSGTRLWPLSRNARPKQLLRLFGGKSLLRTAYERLATVLPPERIHVITAASHLPQIAEELPELPGGNLYGEPEGRDTAAAVGLAAAILNSRDPESVMGIFTADHIIEPIDRFGDAVRTAFRVATANADALVTIGVTVGGPETAFGYVKRGKPLEGGVFEVAAFAEKPDIEHARRYAASGDYFWNSGMFAWRTATILEQLRDKLPATHDGVKTIAASWDAPDRDEKLSTVYPTFQRISIDKSVMEKAERVLVVEMNCTWTDVGSWTQVGEVLPGDAHGNVTTAPRSIDIGSSGVTVVSESKDHLIVTLGLSDVVVVHSPDATLVCNKRDAQALKAIREKLESDYGQTYL